METPIINTHTHIFTEKNIPPLIAKKFVPWPFYYLLHIGIVFRVFKWIKWVEKKIYDPFKKIQTSTISFIKSTPLLRLLDNLLSIVIILNAIVLILRWSDIGSSWIGNILNFLEQSIVRYLLIQNVDYYMAFGLIAALVFLYPSITKLIYSVAKGLLTPLKFIPSSASIEFLKRYMTIAEFAKYKTQKSIFDRLIKMYEPGSKMVVLPMDMEYMGAGKPRQSYLNQLQDIENSIQARQTNVEHLIPFLFVDPRRIKKQSKSEPFFHWDITEKIIDGQAVNWVILKECTLRKCLEGQSPDGSLHGSFKGIKLYPALGYFPFDEELLPLYAYCIQHGIPITTHCVEGTIFYRGDIQKQWLRHPIFKDDKGNPLTTKVKSNFELQINFTHPLNYLVILEEFYLRQKVSHCSNKIKRLFGYVNSDQPLKNNLGDLKINLAHYGGEKEWLRYLSADRKDISAELTENPKLGIELFKKQNPKPNEDPFLWSKPSWIWQEKFEWFSIISSLMLQYKNIYADISYIVHAQSVHPLLNEILNEKPALAKKILFGSDFFVVRNHNSEKEIYSNLLSIIGKDKMNLIARTNPQNFLTLN